MSGFLGTLNQLSGANGDPDIGANQAQLVILQTLKEHPADWKRLAELSLPMSVVQAALQTLLGLGLIEVAHGTDDTYQLSDYAASALTYLTPTS